jgi:hypothetical protein
MPDDPSTLSCIADPTTLTLTIVRGTATDHAPIPPGEADVE